MICPSFARRPPSTNERAQGRPGASRRPRSACNKKARGRTTGSAEIARPSLRDGFNAYTCSPRGPACLPPSPASSSLRRLGLSTGRPGPHDFTSTPCRSSACETHNVKHTLRHDASIASFGPTFVTIAKRPSDRAGMRGNVRLICPTAQANSFYRKEWPGCVEIASSGKSMM